MTTMMADNTFGLSSQALAILALLNQQEPHFADYSDGNYQINIHTYPWYNCRERGVAITVQRKLFGGRGLVIVFGECRNSDSIFIDSWEMDNLPMNGPTLKDFSDEAYAQRTYAPYRDLSTACDIIMEKAARFYTYDKSLENK